MQVSVTRKTRALAGRKNCQGFFFYQDGAKIRAMVQYWPAADLDLSFSSQSGFWSATCLNHDPHPLHFLPFPSTARNPKPL